VISGRRFPIFLYHGVRECEDDAIRDPYYTMPEVSVRRQLSWLAENRCKPLALCEAISMDAVDERSFALTVDDGLKSGYTVIFLLLMERGIRACFFPIVGMVGRKGWVSWRDLDEMRRSGMEIGSHTMTHANLAELSTAEALEELASSKKLLEDRLGAPVKFLSLPGGYRGHSTTAIAAEAGYVGICGSELGYNIVPVGPYNLKRFCLRASDDESTVRGVIERRFLDLAPRYLAEKGKAAFRRVFGEKSYAAFRSRLVPPGVEKSLPRFPLGGP